MEIAIILLTTLGIILPIIVLSKGIEDWHGDSCMVGLGAGILFSMLIIGILYVFSIPPINVYRGKTTLEITYKDSIPIDSVVVYKNK